MSQDEVVRLRKLLSRAMGRVRHLEDRLEEAELRVELAEVKVVSLSSLPQMCGWCAGL